MPTIQIKNVPEKTHAVLRRRAAEAHQSLQAYLLAEIESMADRPTMGEIFDRIESEESGGSLSLEDAAEWIRADRESH